MEDGNWYAVDATWDDPSGSDEIVSGRERHTYFLVGQSIYKTHDIDRYSEGYAYAVLPELSVTAYPRP